MEMDFNSLCDFDTSEAKSSNRQPEPVDYNQLMSQVDEGVSTNFGQKEPIMFEITSKTSGKSEIVILKQDHMSSRSSSAEHRQPKRGRGSKSDNVSRLPTGRYKCNFCTKTYPHRTSVYKHIEASHKNIRHTCKKCEKSYSSAQGLREHIRKLHPDDPDLVAASTGVIPTKGSDEKVTDLTMKEEDHKSNSSDAEIDRDNCEKNLQSLNLADDFKASGSLNAAVVALDQKSPTSKPTTTTTMTTVATASSPVSNTMDTSGTEPIATEIKTPGDRHDVEVKG